jgi:hypothetical protein
MTRLSHVVRLFAPSLTLMGIEPVSPAGWGEDGLLSRWRVSTARPGAVEPYG